MALTGSFGGGTLGKTATAIATVQYIVVPPYSTPYSVVTSSGINPYTIVTHINQTNANTANVTTIMRPIGKTTTTAAATTITNTIVVAGDPGNIAGGFYNPLGTNNNISAGDVICIAHNDGTVGQFNVGAYNSTSKTITVNVNTTSATNSGAAVWFYGVFTDTDPITGAAFPGVICPINATSDAFITYGRGFAGAKAGDPLVLYNPNGTSNTVINYVEYTYDRGL